MVDVFLATLSPMMVLFMCIIIGFILNKKKICPPNAATVLSRMETYVLVPALVINTFMNNCTVTSLAKSYSVMIYAAIILVVAMVIAIPLSKVFVKDGYVRNIYKYALVFGNCGFVGNAVALALMGDEGLYKYLLFTLVLNVIIYLWGYPMLTGQKGGKHMLKNLINPVFIAMAVGIFLGITGVGQALPSFFGTTVSNLGACMGPVAMILTGFVIADYDFVTLFENKKVYAATFLRLIVLPLIFLVLLKLIGAGRDIMFFCLFAFAAPLGLNTVVFPASVGGDTSTGAAMAVISHTLCVITIPLLYTLVTWLF